MQDPVLIVGGGLAGSLAALTIARYRPEIPILLLEAGDRIGGNHTWSFFDSDVPPGGAEWVRALKPARWASYRVAFPRHERRIVQGYNAISSHRLDELVRERLAPGQVRCGCKVVAIEPRQVTLANGETIRAAAVIDARGPAGPMDGLELGWQKFVGIEFAASAADAGRATIMDATVPQIDGYRFFYTLPFAEDRVLLEDTYYSDGPALDVATVSDRVRAMAAAQGIAGTELRHEAGVLPICIGGDPAKFWPIGDPVARLGIRGGFFHATTGYSFSLALRIALELARVRDLSAPGLAAWTRRRFLQHWRASAYFRMLNGLLFHAAAPEGRYRVFERFYRLSEPLIARFYSGHLTLGDKARILTGRPPVPIPAALRALHRSATASP